MTLEISIILQDRLYTQKSLANKRWSPWLWGCLFWFIIFLRERIWSGVSRELEGIEDTQEGKEYIKFLQNKKYYFKGVITQI